jgi:hypothetical protein
MADVNAAASEGRERKTLDRRLARSRRFDNGEVRQEGAEQGEESHAGAQEGHAQEWSIREARHESQTGDRDRLVGGSASGRQSSKEETFLSEEVKGAAEPIELMRR